MINCTFRWFILIGFENGQIEYDILYFLVLVKIYFGGFVKKYYDLLRKNENTICI